MQKTSTLRNYQFKVSTGRTSMRLEPQFYEALQSIAKEAETTTSHIVEQVRALNHTRPLTTAVRVFILEYFMWKAKTK